MLLMATSVHYQWWWSMFELLCPAKARLNMQLYNYMPVYLTILSCHLF